MSARRVGSRLKELLHPLLVEQGFEVDGRNAVRSGGGPIAVAVEVASLSKRMAGLLDLPPASFTATIGVDYVATQPAGIFAGVDPWVPDVAGAGLVVLLSVTPGFGGATDRPDVWPVRDADGADAAVEDLATAWADQAEPLLDTFTDLDTAYRTLRETDAHIQPGAPGQPEVRYPGTPGSINREEHLAVLAALRAAPDDEVVHLENLVALTTDDRYTKRLRDLGS